MDETTGQFEEGKKGGRIVWVHKPAERLFAILCRNALSISPLTMFFFFFQTRLQCLSYSILFLYSPSSSLALFFLRHSFIFSFSVSVLQRSTLRLRIRHRLTILFQLNFEEMKYLLHDFGATTLNGSPFHFPFCCISQRETKFVTCETCAYSSRSGRMSAVWPEWVGMPLRPDWQFNAGNPPGSARIGTSFAEYSLRNRSVIGLLMQRRLRLFPC